MMTNNMYKIGKGNNIKQAQIKKDNISIIMGSITEYFIFIIHNLLSMIYIYNKSVLNYNSHQFIFIFVVTDLWRFDYNSHSIIIIITPTILIIIFNHIQRLLLYITVFIGSNLIGCCYKFCIILHIFIRLYCTMTLRIFVVDTES